MTLQDYTKNDIRNYVYDTLYQDTQFTKLAEQDKQAEELRDQITEKANGVFLWVFLVVRSLLSGLTDGNSFTELQQRVNDFPEALEDYFKLILSNIEPFYRAQTAHIFLTAIQATRPQSIVVYAFLEDVIRDPDFALGDVQFITDDRIILMLEEQRKYLNARCKDLLEISVTHNEHLSTPYFLLYKVDFLHRTVRDFLHTSNVYDDLKRKAASSFDARKALYRVHLAQIKAGSPYPLVEQASNDEDALLAEAIYDAYDIETHHGVSEIAHLEDLDRVMSEIDPDITRFQCHWANWFFRRQDSYTPLVVHFVVESFLPIAVEARLHKYVTHKLEENPTTLFEKRSQPLLLHALKKSEWAKGWFPISESFFDVDMVRLLLDHGANPNERVVESSITVWNSFLLYCSGGNLRFMEERGIQREYTKQLFKIAEMMVEHGADVDLRSTAAGYMYYDAPETAAEMLKRALQPKDWARLEELMEEKRIANIGGIASMRGMERWFKRFSWKKA